MQPVQYVDTVFGQLGPFNRTGNNSLFTIAPSKEMSKVIFARGACKKGDGGGGIFTWDKNEGIDNGGTIIVAGASAPGQTGSCWRRLYSGHYDVRWFGAQGDKTTDDTLFIQLAINAARDAAGGVVYFPPGVYSIGGTGIQIPKKGSPNDQPYPLTLKGAGTGTPFNDGVDGCSTLRGDKLQSGYALINYDKNDTTDVEFHAFEDLTFTRENTTGPILFHDSPGAFDTRARFFIRRCIFNQSDADIPSEDPLIYIAGGWNGAIQDVALSGGKYCLILKDSARYTIERVMTSAKGNTRNFIVLDGGGSHYLRNIRSEGGSPRNNGILLDEDVIGLHVTGSSYPDPDHPGEILYTTCGDVIIDNFTTEGHEESFQIYLERAYAVRIRNLSLGSMNLIENTTVATNGRPQNNALRIGTYCSNIHVDGGLMQGYPVTYNPQEQTVKGNCSILIEGGARHIKIDDVSFVDGAQNNVVIDEASMKVINVQVSVIEKINDAMFSNDQNNNKLEPYNYYFKFSRGIVSDGWVDNSYLKIHLDSPTSYHQEAGTLIYHIAQSLNGISPAYEGAIVTCIVPSTASSVTFFHNIGGGDSYIPFYFPSQSPLVVAPGTVVRFIRSDDYWYLIQ